MRNYLLLILSAMAVLLFITGCEQDKNKNKEQSRKSLEQDTYTYSAKNLYGETVNGNLTDKKVYFIHYWATWCGPCVNEMPDLAKLAEKYSEDVGFIGLVGDYGDNTDGAVKITESAGIPKEFVMLDASDESVKPLVEMTDSGFFPTTVILVNGKVYGEQLVGAQGDMYKKSIEKALREFGGEKK